MYDASVGRDFRSSIAWSWIRKKSSSWLWHDVDVGLYGAYSFGVDFPSHLETKIKKKLYLSGIRYDLLT